MTYEEWNKSDCLDVRLYAPVNPVAGGDEGLDALLEVIERDGGLLRPDKLASGRRYNYSLQRARQLLAKEPVDGHRTLFLERTADPKVACQLAFLARKVGFYLLAWAEPLGFFREPDKQEERAAQVLRLVRALAAHCPPSYGFAHSCTDMLLGSDPHPSDSDAPDEVYEAYWLNLYGRRMVESLGRERVLSVACWHLEELPDGSVLWLTRPTPADFDSEPARLAQARALVHLRPELELEAVLASLRERSLAFQPLEPRFHPDLAPLLQLHLADTDLTERRKQVERFNALQPPEVTEWLPAHQAPPPDVGDAAAEAQRYEAFHAERLIALLYKEVPSLMKETPESLPLVEYRADWHSWYAAKPEDKEQFLIPMLGGYLGLLLVRHLGGRWVPRRSLDEAQVVVGARAWLPFLRARHLLRDKTAWMDSSLTQLYRAAARGM